MKYKEGLNGGMDVNEGAELEKESKSVCQQWRLHVSRLVYSPLWGFDWGSEAKKDNNEEKQ